MVNNFLFGGITAFVALVLCCFSANHTLSDAEASLRVGGQVPIGIGLRMLNADCVHDTSCDGTSKACGSYTQAECLTGTKPEITVWAVTNYDECQAVQGVTTDCEQSMLQTTCKTVRNYCYYDTKNGVCKLSATATNVTYAAANWCNDGL